MADLEVNKVIEELTSELLAPAGTVPTKALPALTRPVTKVTMEVSDDNVVDADLAAMQARLGTL